jgi:hypothetical protein
MRKTASQIFSFMDASGTDGTLEFNGTAPRHGKNMDPQTVGTGVRTYIGKKFHFFTFTLRL